jgi:excinuclease ABC subunit C
LSSERQRPESPPGGFDVSGFLRQLTGRPGVYRMLGADGSILYVGKARNLKRRVASYFKRSTVGAKTQAMVAQVVRVEVTVTRTEDEALLLESNLIKTHQPRYNVVFRDDKSYPFLFLSGNHAFPRLAFHRGAQRTAGRYFGPYPNAGAVREMQDSLHKLFRIRSCDDSFFANRSRPCLQYQIKRCTAPCVDLVTTEDYRRDVEDATNLLDGKAEEVMQDLVRRMEQAAATLEFEQAARYREQISTIRRLQEQPLQAGTTTDCDVIVGNIREGTGCVVIISIRNRMNFGHRSFFPRVPAGADAAELLSAFIGQHYLNQPPPRQILLSQDLPERKLLEQALGSRAGRRVKLISRPRGPRQRLLQIAQATLQQALGDRLASHASTEERLQAMQVALQLEALPHHIECFDISHTRGERAVASCVVFVDGQPEKSSYRIFNIDGIEPGDDYAALRQAIGRRFARLKKGEGRMPDVLLIDGGVGQLTQGMSALQELQIESVRMVAVAKGPSRKPGLEQLLLPGRKQALTLSPDSPALHLIQQIRDEAHRFAISGHRRQRDKARTRSVLDDIRGLGPSRRQKLLRTFGGTRQLARASIDELMRVEGISATLAQKIYDHFHDGG